MAAWLRTAAKVFLLSGAMLCAVMARAAAGSEAAIVELTIGGHRLTAEIAATPSARQRGLMHRASLPEDHGMLFVFARTQPVCLWMKDTSLVLSAAFLDADGVIVSLAEMSPLSLARHCSPRPVRYALEMAGGWFSRHGLSAGMRVIGLEQLPPAEP